MKTRALAILLLNSIAWQAAADWPAFLGGQQRSDRRNDLENRPRQPHGVVITHDRVG